MINTWTVEGYLGRDPELKTLHDQKTVCNFSIGHTVYKKGEKETMWVNVQTWGKLAENCAEWLSKGSRVTVSGKGLIRKFTKKNGEPGAAIECLAHEVSFPSKRESEEMQLNKPVTSQKPPKLDDMEIPF